MGRSASDGFDDGRKEGAKTIEPGGCTKLGEGTTGGGLFVVRAYESGYLRHTTPKLASLESNSSHHSLGTRSMINAQCKLFYVIYWEI